MILGKEDIIDMVNKGEIVIDPFNITDVGPCDINFHISNNFARMRNDVDFVLDISNTGYYEDVKKFYSEENSQQYTIHPNEHLLIESIEYIELPSDVTALIALRSTFSRLGLVTPPTLIDPGFRGKIMLHLIGSSFPVKLYNGMPVFKIIFMKLLKKSEGYMGKYQGQFGIVLPRKD